MALSGSGTSAPVGIVAGGMTLANLDDRVRRQLDDTKEPYIWSHELLTDYTNELIRAICLELKLIEDEVTTDIAQITLAPLASSLTLSDKVSYIVKARLASQDTFLDIVTASELESGYPDWRDETASIPTMLVSEGMGDRAARLYPPTLLADTLILTIRRLPLEDLVWEIDLNNPLPLPDRFQFLLIDGLLAKAYGFNDIDAKSDRADSFLNKYKDNIETMKRSLLKSDHRLNTQPIHAGWM